MGFIVAFAFILIIAAVALIAVTSVKEKTTKAYIRLREVAGIVEEEKQAVDIYEDELQGSFYERVIKPVIDGFAKKLTKKGKQDKSAAKLARLLMLAGNPGNLGPTEFMAVRVLCTLISCTIVLVLGLLMGINNRQVLALTMGGMAVAAGFSFILPMFWLKGKIKKRMKMILKQLPDAIDLLVVSVEAGLGFDMAVGKVVEKMEGALTDEFRRALEEMRLGYSRVHALKNILTRTDVEELDTFISSIIQADQLGASISRVLRIQSDQMRTKRRQKVEEEAMKAPIKMLFPMVLFIFPTIFIIVLGPIVIKLVFDRGSIGM